MSDTTFGVMSNADLKPGTKDSTITKPNLLEYVQKLYVSCSRSVIPESAESLRNEAMQAMVALSTADIMQEAQGSGTRDSIVMEYWLQPPHAGPQSSVLVAIAEAFHCAVVNVPQWTAGMGDPSVLIDTEGVDMYRVYGREVDLDAVHVLTSGLLPAAAAHVRDHDGFTSIPDLYREYAAQLAQQLKVLINGAAGKSGVYLQHTFGRRADDAEALARTENPDQEVLTTKVHTHDEG